MSSRSKRRKVGSTRMDAALDAMHGLGFPDQAVRRSVKALLKVYGDDGWPFIEDGAYKLLIETLLEEPDQTQKDHLPKDATVTESGSKGHDEQEEIVKETSQELNVEASHATQLPTGNISKQDECQEQDSEAKSPPEVQGETLPRPACSSPEVGPNLLHQKQLNQALLSKCDMVLNQNHLNGNSSAQYLHPELGPVLEDHRLPEQVQVLQGNIPVNQDQLTDDCSSPGFHPKVGLTPRSNMRKPCYGWISNDEDEDEDENVISLTPSRHVNCCGRGSPPPS